LEVETYKTLPDKDLKAAAANMFQKYVAEGAVFELNISRFVFFPSLE
jgi:hypothetical protein